MFCSKIITPPPSLQISPSFLQENGIFPGKIEYIQSLEEVLPGVGCLTNVQFHIHHFQCSGSHTTVLVQEHLTPPDPIRCRWKHKRFYRKIKIDILIHYVTYLFFRSAIDFLNSLLLLIFSKHQLILSAIFLKTQVLPFYCINLLYFYRGYQGSPQGFELGGTILIENNRVLFW